MSRSIHQTTKQVARANTRATLTLDNPDLIALAQKTRYKQTQRRKRTEDALVPLTGVKGRSRTPTVK